jgi:membrane protein implicated in regulation of membrane protease activity
MTPAEIIATLASPWSWAVLAVVLASAELMLPGAFLIWLGAAAGATALLTGIFGLPWEVQCVAFAGLAILSVLLARNFMPDRDAEGPEPALNRRSERMIGMAVTVLDPIGKGQGSVQIGDSPWHAEGPDLPAGARARIVAIDGNTVRVEAE